MLLPSNYVAYFIVSCSLLGFRVIYASFGGLLMILKGDPSNLNKLEVNKRLFLLMKKVWILVNVSWNLGCSFLYLHVSAWKMFAIELLGWSSDLYRVGLETYTGLIFLPIYGIIGFIISNIFTHFFSFYFSVWFDGNYFPKLLDLANMDMRMSSNP